MPDYFQFWILFLIPIELCALIWAVNGALLFLLVLATLYNFWKDRK